MAVNNVTIEGFANFVESGEWAGRDGGEATPWCSFSLAHQSYAGKSDGEAQYKDNYFRVKIKGGLAKLAAEHLAGDGPRRVLVVGHLTQRNYDDNGTNRSVVEIMANDLRRLDNVKSFSAVGVGGGSSPSDEEEPF